MSGRLMPRSRTRFRTPLDFVARRLPRTVCSFDTVASTQTDEELPVRVFNFSEQGFMLACSKPLPSGARITLTLQGIGEAEARILWSREVQAGGEFMTPIDVERLLAAVEEMDRDPQ